MLLFEGDAGTTGAMGTDVGQLGGLTLRVRCCGDLVAVTNFELNTITLARWTEDEFTILKTIDTVEEPVHVALRKLPATGVQVLSVGPRAFKTFLVDPATGDVSDEWVREFDEGTTGRGAEFGPRNTALITAETPSGAKLLSFPALRP